MIILALRTDKPEAELYLYENDIRIDAEIWQAHRQLAETLHAKVRTLLERHGRQLRDVTGIACYQGPGSFTGLRIGLTVANGLAYALGVPVVANQGEDWAANGIKQLINGADTSQVVPFYGADVHITTPKK